MRIMELSTWDPGWSQHQKKKKNISNTRGPSANTLNKSLGIPSSAGFGLPKRKKANLSSLHCLIHFGETAKENINIFWTDTQN